MGVRCFWLERADQMAVLLRIYTPRDQDPCPLPWGYHDAKSERLAVVPVTWYPSKDELPEGEDSWVRKADGSVGTARFDWPGHDDPRWPRACECGYEFTEDDRWQHWKDALYLRSDTGEETTLRDAPDGAMWNADWMPFSLGPDGMCLVVKVPGGAQWMIDSEASNCTRPGDSEHHCWVRHGTPPLITVGKDGGPTCEAGGGSIQALQLPRLPSRWGV